MSTTCGSTYSPSAAYTIIECASMETSCSSSPPSQMKLNEAQPSLWTTSMTVKGYFQCMPSLVPTVDELEHPWYESTGTSSGNWDEALNRGPTESVLLGRGHALSVKGPATGGMNGASRSRLGHIVWPLPLIKSESRHSGSMPDWRKIAALCSEV